ncbi:MAG: BBP7 family outer membrane beta-barrel protein [Planctomycetota bacterium]
MASRKWLSWLMGCGLLVGNGLMGSAYAQDDYSGGGGYSSYGDGASIPNTPPGPYSPPMGQGGADPYWVAPTPETPQIFSQPDGLQSAFRSWDGFFFRTEYLQFDYTRPGDVLLGAPQFGIADPTKPFQVFDGLGNLLGFAEVPSLKSMKTENIPGVRGTVGIPLIFGSFEGSVFGMGTAQQSFQDDTLNGTLRHPFLGTSTLINGVVDNNIELYNDTYRATFTSKLWSSDMNLFFDGPSSNYFSFSPMIGFKYLDLREGLQQRGSFIPDPLLGLPKVVTDIDSYAANQVFAPQIGLRSKFENSFMAVTFDPKFGLGANVYKNRLEVNHFRGNGDPFTVMTDSSAQVVPTIDLNLTGRIKVSPNVNLTAGYNFIFVSRVTRPQDNIYYNDTGALNPPGVVLQTHKEDIIFQGLTLGIEFRRP